MTHTHDNNQHHDQDDNVVYLPANHDQSEPEIVTAEVVRADERAPAPTGRAREAFNTRLVPDSARERMATGAVVLARHARPVATTGLKAGARHALYPAYGARTVWRRYRDNHGGARFERQMRAAEARGDQEALRYWQEADATEKQRRHDRHMDWLDSPMKLVKSLAWGLGALAGLLLVLGIALAVGGDDLALILAPIGGIIDAIQWAWWFGTAYGALLLLGGTTAGVAYLWNEGRRCDDVLPDWTHPAATAAGRPSAQVDEEVTPSKVVAALADLGIAKLRKAIKDMPDGGAGMLSPIVLAGPGVEVDVTLPRGINTEDVKKRGVTLAQNLDRHEHEVFIDTAPAARTVRLWIADPGALDEPIDPSPLVIDGESSTRAHNGRAPWGRNLRGDAVALRLWQMHLLITGLSNMGKTAALRALVLWLVFDRAVELRLADLKGIGDWHMFDGLASVLIEGPTDGHVIAATEMLEDGVAEMEHRMLTLDKVKYPDGPPPDLPGYHPIYLVVDEAQVAFMCPAVDDAGRPYGGQKSTSRYYLAARKIHNQGRAVNVHLWQGTQDPTNDNLPKLVREGAHLRLSLALGSREQAEMAVGKAAVNNGAAPHELQQQHKGTVVATGAGVPTPKGKDFEIVRTHYISGTEATTLVANAKQLRTQPTTTIDTAEEERDLLLDVLAVLGNEDRVKATDVTARLRKLAPGYAPYKELKGVDLTATLEGHGIKITLFNGTPMVYAERVRTTLAYRDGTTLDDTDDPA